MDEEAQDNGGFGGEEGLVKKVVKRVLKQVLKKGSASPEVGAMDRVGECLGRER